MNRENLERYVGERVEHARAERGELSQSKSVHEQTRSAPEHLRAPDHEGRDELTRDTPSRAAPERTRDRDEGRTR